MSETTKHRESTREPQRDVARKDPKLNQKLRALIEKRKETQRIVLALNRKTLTNVV